MTLRKVVKTRASFPNEESTLKLLYLALRNIAQRWRATPSWRTSLITSSCYGATGLTPPWRGGPLTKTFAPPALRLSSAN
jgi:putative transposase